MLFSVTAVELAILVYQTPSFELVDWIYVSQHLIVLALAFTRRAPATHDYSLGSSIAVVVSYGYPYAQIAYLGWRPGEEISQMAGLVLVTVAALLSFASLVTLGRSFGVRPALRRLVTDGPYRFVRQPIYARTWSATSVTTSRNGTLAALLMVLAGWISLLTNPRGGTRALSTPSMARLRRLRSIPFVSGTLDAGRPAGSQPLRCPGCLLPV